MNSGSTIFVFRLLVVVAGAADGLEQFNQDPVALMSPFTFFSPFQIDFIVFIIPHLLVCQLCSFLHSGPFPAGELNRIKQCVFIKRLLQVSEGARFPGPFLPLRVVAGGHSSGCLLPIRTKDHSPAAPSPTDSPSPPFRSPDERAAACTRYRSLPCVVH